jgi:hypothetical protein
MRTVTHNVWKETHDWLDVHLKAGATIVQDTKGVPIRAEYDSPYQKYGFMADHGGNFELPDIDYYNQLTDPTEMSKMIEELAATSGESEENGKPTDKE